MGIGSRRVPAGRRVTNVLLSSAHETGVGGIQVVLRDLINGLEQQGRRVYFVYGAPLPQVRMVETVNSLGRQSFYVPMPTIVKHSPLLSLLVFLAYGPIALIHMARLIHRTKIDLINCHYLDLYLIHLVIAARVLRVPAVVSVHGADIDAYAQSGWADRLVYRLIMRGAHRIVACSDALARRTIEIFPDVESKVTYVHNGIDLARYVDGPGSCAVSRPFLLSVCRHVHKKGVDTLLHAFALVLRDLPDMSLVLVGGGPLLEENQALARTLEIEQRVVFAGNIAHADVSAFFAECRLFVLPSRAEPFGIVLLEAAYYKKGIVSTRVGGVPEIIVDGFNGVLVEPDAPASMASAIVALVRDPQRADQLGARAYQTLMTRFLWKDRVQDYIAIYEGRPAPAALDVEPHPA